MPLHKKLKPSNLLTTKIVLILGLSAYYLFSQNAGLHQAGKQVPLLRDHVRQLVHLRLEERDLLGRLDELVVVLVDIPLQLRVRVLRQRLQKWSAG